MLDYFAIFTKGGALLWAFQLTALKGDPLNALVRECLLEDRSAERSYTYNASGGAGYTLKWSFNNTLGLVFVAVYQKALKLLYVDALLEQVKQAFVVKHYQPRKYDYPEFEDSFRALLRDAEAAADVSKHTPAPRKQAVGNGLAGRQRSKTGTSGVRIGGTGDDDEDDGEDGSGASSDSNELRKAANANDVALKTAVNGLKAETQADSGADSTDGEASGLGSAVDLSALAGKARRGTGAGRKALIAPSKAKPSPEKKKKAAPKKKEARNWDAMGAEPRKGAKGEKQLDFSADGPSDAGPAVALAPLTIGKSRVDADEDDYSSDEEVAEVAEAAAKPAGGGLLSSFVRSLGVNTMGTAALTRDDIAPALAALKQQLMERNVAAEIADKLAESVAASLEGQALGSFTRISTAVRSAVEAALTRILTPKRSIDILREVHAARAKGRPYTIVFVGVNGVGKSTNLAKICYWLLQNDVKVLIAACDTFRSGAVEQLKTHCGRLGVPLYERGYERDPAKVAAEAVKAAARDGADVVLVDTAGAHCKDEVTAIARGRMQDNEPLMRALSNLVTVNDPDLVLFVGEALVGNDAVDQLSKFNGRLADLAGRPNPHTIDGIVLTKMDTIDDKVGAALSMVYTSGAPIMFCGVGQTYVDLKRLNVKSVVRSLLK